MSKEEMVVSFLMQGPNIHLYIDGVAHVINKETHINYDELVQALKDEDWSRAAELADVKTAFMTYASKDGSVTVEVKQNDIICNGEKLHDALGNRLFEMAKNDLPIQFFIEFIARKNKNPSQRANTELFGMLEKNNLPITPAGTFQAYKAVKRHSGKPFVDQHGRMVKYNDFVDIHSGKIRNNPGDEVSMPRNQVCEDKNRTCAAGLHFTSLGYAKSFGGHDGSLVIVDIDPADVVSIPTDYNDQKGRCCKYTVVKLHTEGAALAEEAFDSPVSNFGYKTPDGKRWHVLSTAKANPDELVGEYDTRKEAREYASQFEDVKVVDTWAIAKLRHAEKLAEEAAAKDAEEAE